LAEFEKLLPAFQAAYNKKYPADRTLDGQARQRRAGAGAKGKRPHWTDKLLFIVVYQKTNPWHTMPGLRCNVSQAHTNDGLHHLWPVLHHALREMGQAPEREASQVAHNHVALEGPPALAMDGPERRRQRPIDATQHKEHDRGKKKTPTDKHILLVNAHPSTVVSLGPPLAGSRHDKKAAAAVPIASPVNATRAKDPGFPGYEPAGVRTAQPKKPPQARS